MTKTQTSPFNAIPEFDIRELHSSPAEPPKRKPHKNSRQIDVVSSGTLPFPSAIATGAIETKPQPPVKKQVFVDRVFPVDTDGEEISIEAAILRTLEAITWRMAEIDRIGFSTSQEYNAAGDNYVRTPEMAVAYENAVNLLITGNERLGRLYKGTEQVISARGLMDMVRACKVVSPVKRMGNARDLLMFKVPDGYSATTSEVHIKDMLALGATSHIRVNCVQDRNRNNELGPKRMQLYTPKGSSDLHTAKFVSFVFRDNFGLESWQPGQYNGALRYEERQNWVSLNLLEH